MLNAADRKKVRKNLRTYSAQFEEADAMEADAATRQLILTRRKQLEEWMFTEPSMPLQDTKRRKTR